jgi:hypothetical protein
MVRPRAPWTSRSSSSPSSPCERITVRGGFGETRICLPRAATPRGTRARNSSASRGEPPGRCQLRARPLALPAGRSAPAASSTSQSAVGHLERPEVGRDALAHLLLEKRVELSHEARGPGPLDGAAEPRGGGVARARGLVVGLACHRHEQGGYPQREQLVVGVVAGRGHHSVEGGVVPAHGIGGLQGRRLHVLAGGEVAQAALRRTGHLGALAKGHEDVGAPRLEAELALGLGSRQQVLAAEVDDRRDHPRLVAVGDRRPAVVGRRDLARLEDVVERCRARQRSEVGPRLPHRPPAPDGPEPTPAPQGIEESEVRVRAVEDDERRIRLRDCRARAAAKPPRPPPFGPGARRAVRGAELDRKALLADDRRGRGHREDERLEAAVEPAGDRHRPGQVAEPGAVGGEEKYPVHDE